MPEPLSPEGYAATGWRCCPYCGSIDVTRRGLRLVGTSVLAPMACLTCDAQWRAVYELTGYEATP